MKFKFTKGELKRQRDALKQYERYLPTLQLKKQQLQLEIMHQHNLLNERLAGFSAKKKHAETWVGLLSEKEVNFGPWLKPREVISGSKNVAGVDLPVFERIDFDTAEYDLFVLPMWVDVAVEAFRAMVSLKEEMKIIGKGADILKHELRITTQRVNLFEKVKIPEAKEAIRLIKIFIGDQMSNAVGRSKIAKRKIEESTLEEAVI